MWTNICIYKNRDINFFLSLVLLFVPVRYANTFSSQMYLERLLFSILWHLIIKKTDEMASTNYEAI